MRNPGNYLYLLIAVVMTIAFNFQSAEGIGTGAEWLMTQSVVMWFIVEIFLLGNIWYSLYLIFRK